ncbi:Dyp-type peroxidase [Paracidobacterium acidisoli]|uniref:Peroxidase n=1 Tax=Paracidobacterium acidisoli TaxID=2303751 RepID=A0A372INW3_9BACT|nr:peroxidase [Paracidobacterium acidisoli]MBT9332110.1 hypothetical protein [Paracidobacterium acidisoli]
MAKNASVDFADMQGLLRFGYAKLTEASFLLLRIRDAAAARAWLAAAPVSTAEYQSPPPAAALQIAFTSEGLRVLGLAGDVLAGFSAEFLAGMSSDRSRSRRLGDTGNNAPQYWQWGGAARVPHVAAMLYAREGGLGAWTQTVKGVGWDAAFEVMDCLPTSNLYGVEPFGFTDGVSQPTIDWEQQHMMRDPNEPVLDYSNLVAPGEFLLGYPNEYYRYTDRPLLSDESEGASILPGAEDRTGMRDLGRNGSYLVMRQLAQDVRGFWKFANGQANGDADERRQLAQAMVGRTLKGDPLAQAAERPITGVDAEDAAQNGFTFDADANGTRCPFGAHIRRANPRTNDLPGAENHLISKLVHTLGFEDGSFRDDVISPTRFHRLLRRGREYGPGLTQQEALEPAPSDDPERGIHFISLGANISRQFEFVQSAWLMSSKFGGMTGESDPLLGNREPISGCPVTSGFSLPREGSAPRRLEGLPQFIAVRGGAYFFLPGIRALRYLARER